MSIDLIIFKFVYQVARRKFNTRQEPGCSVGRVHRHSRILIREENPREKDCVGGGDVLRPRPSERVLYLRDMIAS